MKANILELQKSNKDKRYLPLGQICEGPIGDLTRLLKLEKSIALNNIWATLGWENDSKFTPSGELQFSKEGNWDEGQYSQSDKRRKDNKLTMEEVKNLREMHPDLKIKRKGSIIERFINFDEVNFTLPSQFNPVDLPRLRLTLHLAHDEGAVVYYQHSKRNEYNDEDAISEYVFCENDSDDKKHTYFVPIEPKYELIPVDPKKGIFKQSDRLTGLSFIIKVLVFKKKKRAQKQRFVDIEEHLSKNGKKIGVKKYQLLLFDVNKNAACKNCGDVKKKKENKEQLLKSFDQIIKLGQIDNKKKTLFLIHGTFVDTVTSFEDLICRNANQPSALENIIRSKKIEQIIAFDHPTVLADAKMNVEWLERKLASLKVKFEKPVSILTSSRGGMVGEYMVVYPTLKPYIPEIDKLLMFSPGNGCGYFDVAKRFAKGANAMRVVSPGSSKFLMSLTQFAVGSILELPGFKMMTKDSPTYNDILKNKTTAYPNTQIINIISDWDKTLIPDDKVFKRVICTCLDKFIVGALGEQHDWVIGVNAQVLKPATHKNTLDFRYSVHGRYFEMNYVLDYKNKKKIHPHQIIMDTLI